jgi:hypothetical protein
MNFLLSFNEVIGAGTVGECSSSGMASNGSGIGNGLDSSDGRMDLEGGFDNGCTALIGGCDNIGDVV